MPNKLNVVAVSFAGGQDITMLQTGEKRKFRTFFSALRLAAIQSYNPLSIWSNSNLSGTRKDRARKLMLINSLKDILIFEKLLLSEMVDILFIDSNEVAGSMILECAKRARELFGDRILIVLWGRPKSDFIFESEFNQAEKDLSTPLQLMLTEKIKFGLIDIVIGGHADFIIDAIGEIAYKSKQAGDIRGFIRFLPGIEAANGDWIIGYIKDGNLVTVSSERKPYDNSILQPLFTLFGVYTTNKIFESRPTVHIFSDLRMEYDCNCSACIKDRNEEYIKSTFSISERLLGQLIEAASIIRQDYNCIGCAVIEDPVFLFGSRELLEEFCKLIENHPISISYAIRFTADQVLKHKDIILRLCNSGLEHILIDLETFDVHKMIRQGIKLLARNKRKKRQKGIVEKAVLYLDNIGIKSGASLWFNLGESNIRKTRLFDFVHSLQKHSHRILRPVCVNIFTSPTIVDKIVKVSCKNGKSCVCSNCVPNKYVPNINEFNKYGNELLSEEIDEINFRTKGMNFYSPKIRIEDGDVYPISGINAINNLQHFTQVGFPTQKSFERAMLSLSSVYYGGIGTPADRQLSQIIANMEGGNHAILTPTGHAAAAQVMCALLRSGDHALVVDTAAFSTKFFLCDNYLNNFGVEIEYYSPCISVYELKEKIKSNTKIIFLESPGSYTYEIQDLHSIVSVAKQMGVITVFDNTWSASKFLKPLEWGIDIVVLSLGKYHFAISGVSMGAIITEDKELFRFLQNKSLSVGNRVSQLDCQLAYKALQSLDKRLMAQQESACQVAECLLQIQEIQTVIFPALKNFEQYADWKNLYTGVNSLLTIKLQEVLKEQYSTYFLNYLASLGAIAIGDSYGGSFSLIRKINLKINRKLYSERIDGQYFRIYVGHENSSILINHIKKAFQKTTSAKDKASSKV